MAGLAPSMAKGGAADAMPEGRPAADGGAGPEKELYRKFLANTLNAVYDPETAESLAQVMRNSAQAGDMSGGQAQPVVESLALAVSSAVARVAYDGLENGLPITRDMAAAAAATVAADIGRNMAEAAGVPPLSREHIQAVFLRSTELLAEQRDQRQASNQQGREAPPETRATPPGNGLMAKHAAGMMPAQGGMR